LRFNSIRANRKSRHIGLLFAKHVFDHRSSRESSLILDDSRVEPHSGRICAEPYAHLEAGWRAATRCAEGSSPDGVERGHSRADGSSFAAAHRTLPFGTMVRVENLANGREVVVRVNDRGPFTGGRVIDVSRAAAEKLGMIKAGIARVRVSVVDGTAIPDSSCDDPVPRTLTADAVAADAAKTKAPPAPESEPSERQTAALDEPAQPGTAPATDGSTGVKTGEGSSGTVLVATVQYDEGSGERPAAPARPTAATADAAAFSDEPRLDELGDAPILASVADIPLPRPRPPVFTNAPAPSTFNRQLALRFLDAFAPQEPALPFNLPLGYAPSEPRGAVITE
jgi:rare lipoprotein A